MMRLAFRADASLSMGTGHVMRCLTLAEALKNQGAESHFIVREHPGHLQEVITSRGFGASCLPTVLPRPLSDKRATGACGGKPANDNYSRRDWGDDAQQTRAILATLQPDWLVVDHYALDQRWESAVQPYCRKLAVIDDLADRPHRCDLLLDQNLGRQVQDYAGLVPQHCNVLTGPQYALLRPEFAALRPYSLQRRRDPALKHLLISMGGVDLPNATGLVLQALKPGSLPRDCRISVVMGITAPWLQQVREQASHMAWPTEVLVNTSDLAQCMADSDLAIGAAGSTSWERCCLGLPTLIVVLADNQWPGARALQEARAGDLIGGVSEIASQLAPTVQALTHRHRLLRLSAASAAVADGRGVDRVLHELGLGVLHGQTSCG